MSDPTPETPAAPAVAPAAAAPAAAGAEAAAEAPPAAAAAPAEGGATPGCPLSLEVLTANFRKHVDPKAPVPLRMMGAKGLVPMGPREMATALFMLTFDADAGVRETAAKSAAALPDKILSVALRDETADSVVLDYYAGVLSGRPEYLEIIALNAGASDKTVAKVAALAPERVTEIIAQNQLRILRDQDIVRALCNNPVTRPSTIDSVCDFCVRSGLVLDDLPAFKAARRRILGGTVADEEAAAAAHAKAVEAEAEAERILATLGAGSEHLAVDPDAPPASTDEANRRMTISQQIMKLSVAKKIEWANKKGNKEVRTLLLRDPNKLVQMAVVQSPRITEDEIAKLSLSRTLPMEVLMYIYNNRQLTRNYNIKVNLVNNPKVPVAVSMRFLSLLRTSELKALSKNKNVPNALTTAARNMVEKKNQ
jgi:hypothetical protein